MNSIIEQMEKEAEIPRIFDRPKEEYSYEKNKEIVNAKKPYMLRTDNHLIKGIMGAGAGAWVGTHSGGALDGSFKPSKKGALVGAGVGLLSTPTMNSLAKKHQQKQTDKIEKWREESELNKEARINFKGLLSDISGSNVKRLNKELGTFRKGMDDNILKSDYLRAKSVLDGAPRNKIDDLKKMKDDIKFGEARLDASLSDAKKDMLHGRLLAGGLGTVALGGVVANNAEAIDDAVYDFKNKKVAHLAMDVIFEKIATEDHVKSVLISDFQNSSGKVNIKEVLPEVRAKDISDGHHTFGELYHHRAVLFSVVCNLHKEIAWKSKLHHDGTMFDDMFIVGIETPNGQATYHYHIDKYWDLFDVPELEMAPFYDGHTSDEAIYRVELLGKENLSGKEILPGKECP